MKYCYINNERFTKISTKNKDIDYLQLDVRNTQSINECIEIVKKKYGKIDVLINKAGYGIGGFFED
ncbi:short-chain dehydrogenase, partial [Candidatus Marinamargulisbacteria bacterium SCGC AAA071-K20]